MERPTCTTHGDLARRLALGRLDDAAAAAAEASVAGCPACQAWWETTFAPAAALDDAVAAGLRTVVLPTRRHRHTASWLALAATVVLSVGVGTLWLRGVGRELPVETASLAPSAATTAPARVAPATSAPATSAPAETAPATSRAPIVISTFDFEADTVVVAKVDPTPERAEVISALSFESGGLEIVGSST